MGAYNVLYTEVSGTDDLLGTQVWWNSGTLAREFATLVGTGLGLPNFGVFGPQFAYSNDGSNTFVCSYFGGSVNCGSLAQATVTNYAYATPVTSQVPEPGTLALLGLGFLGLGLVRGRKTR